MTGLAASFRWVMCLLCAALLTGCFDNGTDPLDEEKDPYYLTGKNRVMSLDYQGAKESFTKCLEMNPRHGYANLELGLLCEREHTNSARAIYHFEEYLRLRPKAENADVIQQHILACKQELARTVSLAPVSQQMQRERDDLLKENVQLKHQIEELKAQNARIPILPMATQAQAVVVPAASTPVAVPRPATRSEMPVARPVGGNSGAAQAAPAARTHEVKSGETPASIARYYHISLNSLMAANPGLEPRRMRVGQTLNIPSH